jgi:hypothetical protein
MEVCTTKKQSIIKDWLSKSNSGPYTVGDSNKNNLSDFYYLGGTFVYGGEYIKGRLQICSNPLNVLSEDCLDETNCWV